MGETVNFQDIIKKSMLELDAFGNVSYIQIFWGLLVAFGVGMFIYWVYQKCYRGVVYSHNYNVSFVLITIITALIIMTISTNIVLSLGMVGALSIVRFRTAVKDPLDIVYMFWSISAGIATGAGLYPLAICGSLVIALVIWLLSRRKLKETPFLLIVHYEDAAADEQIKSALRKMKYTLKSKTVRKNVTELTVELRVNGDNTAFVQAMSEIPGVSDVALVSYNGDYAP